MIGFNEYVMVKNPRIFPDVCRMALMYILQAKAREKIILRKSEYGRLHQSVVDGGMKNKSLV